ncbi:TPA: hypothetical protein RI785_002433 [Vibrio cholerae]|uniref:Uncharacterized protein n=1 Tax=Vibrio cholerae TaxID=666 RepID=A0A5Q6PES7_VIBCL|nr:hypothetical protein [Vibrio cholerae]KAA1253365.1 hypothetical protein F0M16_17690 [Vibrio cholerae]HDV5593715.1 hypothetical protein [Vibrio cholerae]
MIAALPPVLKNNSSVTGYPRFYHCHAVKATFKANNEVEAFNAIEMGAVEVTQLLYNSLKHTYSVESEVNTVVKLKSKNNRDETKANCGLLDTLSRLNSIWGDSNRTTVV